MKTCATLLLGLILAIPVFSQDRYHCFQKFINAGDSLRKQAATNADAYRLALQKYNSARRCDPAKSDVVDARINLLFNEIVTLKKQSDTNAEKATTANREAAKNLLAARSSAKQALLKQNEAELARIEAVSAKNQTRTIIDALYFYDGKFALAVKNDYSTEYKNQYGFIDKQGKPKVDYKYDEATPFDAYDGYARVKRKGQKYLLDTLKNEYLLAQDTTELNEQTVALDLHEKELESIPLIVFNHPQLKILLVYKNSLTSLSTQIGDLKSLQTLNLSGMSSLTSLPDRLWDLKSLQSLDLRGTKLTSLPDRLWDLKSLQSLNLSFNSKLTSLPTQIGQLTSLQTLNLSGMSSLTSLPSQIGDLKSLQSLDLSFNSKLTSLPDRLWDLKSLQSLDLSGTKLTSLPTQIGQLTSLQSLNLSETNLTSLPDQIGDLKSLQELDLSDTPIPAETIAEIRRMLPNCRITR